MIYQMAIFDDNNSACLEGGAFVINASSLRRCDFCDKIADKLSQIIFGFYDGIEWEIDHSDGSIVFYDPDETIGVHARLWCEPLKRAYFRRESWLANV